MKYISLVPVFAAVIFLFSCITGPIYISQDLSPAEIIQRAQEASDRSRYNVAKQYYKVLLERNPNNIDLVITAEYEIAFINYKQKNFAQAREEFNFLLERYENPEAMNLPPQFRILALRVLERMDEQERQRRLFSRNR
jgi:outer membrane protein assembly factor BamD (BamD/ComL family)